MTDTPAADLSTALPLPEPSEAMRNRLATRRSASAQLLIAPGPTQAQLDDILTLAARTPDHGKLFPWRFVVLGLETRQALAAAFQPLADRQPDPVKARAVLAKLTTPPVTVLVVSSPVIPHKIPLWEQQLSAGAVCMNLEHAANAHGYAASWITDWYSYDPDALALLGLEPHEQVAGFIHLGSLAEPPLERPRPEMAAKVTRQS